MGFVKEFRDFALKGNVVDLAVGIIIGAAFTTIINSVIADLIMPVIAMGGKVDFSNLYYPLDSKVSGAIQAAPDGPLTLAQARAVGPVLAYGNFITVAVNFLILAFCIFLMVKAMNNLRRQQPAAPVPGPTPEVALLTEIRDTLRSTR